MIDGRIAGAPISWGVCEVEGWGHQLPRERVLAEMRDLGLTATEFGPGGYLGDSPDEMSELLRRYDLRAVGGFLPSLLHDPTSDPLPQLDAFVDTCLAAGADVVVLAAHSGVEGYDDRPVLDDVQWKTMLDNLDRLASRARSRGVTAVAHPHIGTMIETAQDVDRVLVGSSIGLCIDTGHLLAAGVDPVALTASHPERVAHVHLKDVDAELAQRVINKALTFSQAVRSGLFRTLGTGDVDVAGMVHTLETAGYQGWYVLEQDVMLAGEPVDAGPGVNVRACLDYLRGLGA